MDFGLPITLIVKAPNQKIADMTVECELEWTIKKLKQHLSDVYPNKPLEKQQKLIYSGKLLTDNQQLKDILHKFDEDQTIHTVHLVCAPSYGAVTSTASLSSTPSPTTSQPSPQIQTNASGIRHRATAASTQPSSQSSTHQHHHAQQQPYVQAMPSNAFSQMYGMNQAGYNMQGMTPEQIMWMQQMYAHQMAQYMQFYQMPYTTQQQPMGGAPYMANPDPMVVDPVMGGANQVRPMGDNQPIRMNAQGGAMMDDDEDDGGNGDWLDWMYTFSRFAVLLSILYFYSSISRFLAVFGAFILFYVYQAGWFQLQRRVPANAAQQAHQLQQQQVQAAVGGQNQNGNNQQPNLQQNQPENQDSDSDSSEDTTEPEPPSKLQLAARFFTTFFTSLIPQAPPAVNAN